MKKSRTSVERWLEHARSIYEHGTDADLVDRALRARGDTDRAALAFLTFERLVGMAADLRAIRSLMGRPRPLPIRSGRARQKPLTARTPRGGKQPR